jgi:hydroxymethylpyrimidine pyrophosphatase-like HAD family hydrolase
LIKNADVGFAAGNALNNIKKAADYIVSDNNHHAIVVAIQILGFKGQTVV